MPKLFISSTLTIAAATLLSHCSVFEKTTNLLSNGGAPLTTETDAPDYFSKNTSRKGLSKIAAKVDASVVTSNELNFTLSPILEQIKAQFPRKNKEYYTQVSKARKEIFQELIDRELILNEFKNLGANIPARDIDREITRRIDTLYNGNRAAYLKDLKKNGLSQSKYRDLVTRTITVGAMKSQHLHDFAPPTTDELQKEYNKFKHKLRDIRLDKASYKKIWIPLDSGELGNTPEDQLQLAESLAARIRKGEPFSELAKEYSSDAYAEEGGQWPMTSRIDFPIHFAPVVFDQPVGKLIGPLTDQYGFHIIQVTKKVNGPSPPLSKVRPQLESRVKADKSAVRFNRWIERLRNKAEIVRYL